MEGRGIMKYMIKAHEYMPKISFTPSLSKLNRSSGDRQGKLSQEALGGAADTEPSPAPHWAASPAPHWA